MVPSSRKSKDVFMGPGQVSSDKLRIRGYCWASNYIHTSSASEISMENEITLAGQVRRKACQVKVQLSARYIILRKFEVAKLFQDHSKVA